MEKHFHYAFIICLAGTLTLFVCTGLGCNDFSIYMPYILKEYGISNTQSSTILLVRSTSVFLSVSLSGRYYRIFSLRLGMLIAALISALSYVIYSISSNYILVLSASALTGAGFGLGATVPVSMLLNRWFKTYRNAAMSICAMGSTIATIGFPTLITNLIEGAGLRAAFLLQSAFMALIAVLCFILIRSDPAEKGTAIFDVNEGRPSDAEDSLASKDRRTETGIIKSDWIVLIPALFLLGVIANPAYNHLSVFFNGQGFSSAAIALAFSFSGIAGCIGKFMFGWFSDKVSVYFCNYLYGALMTFGLLLMCLAGSDTSLYLSVIMFSLGVGISIVGPTAWAGDLSSSEQFDGTIQRFQQMYSLGAIVFALFPGMMADRFGGSYKNAYYVFAVFSAALISAIQYMYIKKKITHG